MVRELQAVVVGTAEPEPRIYSIQNNTMIATEILAIFMDLTAVSKEGPADLADGSSMRQ